MAPIEAAHQTAQRVRNKELSAHESVEGALARLERLNPKLNAFTAVDVAAALHQADAIDDKIARGEDPGPFAGVSFGVKDLEAAAGLPLTMGSRIYAEEVAHEDSIQVARLRAAGAIVLGKTNTPEFGFRPFTTNLVHGPTRNPWNLDRTPGGSSGGTSAAVTAGIVPMGTGSDGGGSIRLPAAFAGCYGIKPTVGRIPRGGPEESHWAFLSHRGPLTRTVRDAARWLDVAAGPHQEDTMALDAPSGHYEATLDKPLRLNRIAWSEDLGYAAVEPEVAKLAREAAATLAEATGAELVDANPGFVQPLEAWMTIAASGDAAMHELWTDEMKALADPEYLRLGQYGANLRAVDYANAIQERHQVNLVMTRFFDQYDLLLTPTSPVTAFPAEGPTPDRIAGQEAAVAAIIAFTHPFNLTGHPGASVPAGLASDGLPVGLQIVAPKFADALVLQASAAFESARPFPWPDFDG